MKAIAAIDLNYGIGKDGRLLAYLPEDLKRFKRITIGKTIVMGHNTLKSLPDGKPLPGRENIVFSRNPDRAQEDCTFVSSVDALLSLIKDKEIAEEDVYVIGGGAIYALLLPYCTEIYLTVIEHHLEADTFFPSINKIPGWRRIGCSQTFQHDLIRYHFEDYERLQG